jgi:hypothetical protein
MKPYKLFVRLFLVIVFTLLSACDKINIEVTYPVRVHKKAEKPDYPVPLGFIRGYFGDEYLTFNQHIEKVQPVDSFSNAYFYGTCKGSNLNQINLLRCDSSYVLAIYIMGYSLDSLPSELPVPSEFGKYSEIQFYQFQDWNSTSPGHYNLIDFYGKSVFITDITDDILTGTFEGCLRSSDGRVINVSDGEFKLSIFRKHMPCNQ